MPLWKIEKQSATLHIKDLDILVVTCRNQTAADGIDPQAADEVFMGFDLSDTVSGHGVPNTDYHVIAGRRNVAGIVRELRAGETLCMTHKFSDRFACVNIPQLDLEVAGAGNDRVATHLNCVHGTGVTLELFEHDARLAVPYADGDILGAGDDVFFVKGKVEDGGGVVAETADGIIIVFDVVDYAG